MAGGSLAWRIAWELALVAAALAAGLAAGALVAYALGAPPLSVIGEMLTSWRVQPDLVVEYTAMLALTGAAFAIPLHTGLFNIGGEGAFQLGALVGLWVAVHTSSAPAALAAAALAGAGLVGLAGILRVRVGVNEVLSTIMLNWIVYWVLLYLVITRLQDPYFTTRTVEVPRGARLPWLSIGGVEVPSTILASAAILAALWVALRLTRWGLLFRFSGANEWSSRTRGVRVGVYRAGSMALAGLLAGVAGALHIIGFSHNIDVTGSGVRNYGFNGIGVALLGRNDPLAILPA
nr:ABC transporter permease [Desulfurococcales archaeon]